MGSIDELKSVIPEEKKVERFIIRYGGKRVYFPDFFKWMRQERKQPEKVREIIYQLYE